MLPFPRMMVYGNIAPTGIKIKKYYKSPTSSMGIDSNNRLWYWGYNAYGGAGDGTTSTDYVNWKLIRNDVLNWWCNGSYGTSVIKTTDGKFWYCGNNGFTTGTWPGTATTTWTEIPFLSGKNVINIQVGDRFMAAQIDDKLYGFGANVNGIFNGSTVIASGSVLSTWTLFSSTYSVKEFRICGAQTYIVTNSNILLGCGSNANNALSSTGIGTVVPFQTLLTVKDMTNPLSSAYKGVLNGNISINVSSVFGRGSGTGYQFGNSSTAVLANSTVISSSWPNYSSMSTISYSGADYGSGSQNCLYVTGTGSTASIYAMGTQTYGELGVGDTTVRQTPALVPFTLNADESILAIVHANNNCTTLYTNKRALHAGRAFINGGYVNLLTFSENQFIPDDWEFDFDPDVKPWY